MATRKEEKARLRAARLEAEQREAAGGAEAADPRLRGRRGADPGRSGRHRGRDRQRRGRLGRATPRPPPTSTPPRAASTASRPTLARAPLLRPSHNLDLENAAEDAGCDPAAQPARRRKQPPGAGRHAPRLPHQPADLGQPRHHPVPAGRRRLREDARADRVRPLARARPDRDPVRARPAGRRTSSPSRGSSTRAHPGCSCSRTPTCPMRSRPPPGPSSWAASSTRGPRRWTRSATSATSSAAAAPRARSRSP